MEFIALHTYGATRGTPGVPELQSVRDTPQLRDVTSGTCWVQQSQRVPVSPNMSWTDPGHVTRGQISTELVPTADIPEAGDSLPREWPHKLQSGESFPHRWVAPWGRETPGCPKEGRQMGNAHVSYWQDKTYPSMSGSFKWFRGAWIGCS